MRTCCSSRIWKTMRTPASSSWIWLSTAPSVRPLSTSISGDHFARAHHLVRVVGRVERHPGVFFLEFFEDLVVVEFLRAEEFHGGDPGPLVDDERDHLAAAGPVAQFEPQVIGETGVPERPELGAERLPVHRVAGLHREVREPGVLGDQVVAFDDHRLHGLGGLGRRFGRGFGETGSGKTGSGETGSGETGSGETGFCETGAGENRSGESERPGEREAEERAEPHYASAASNSATRTKSSPPASSSSSPPAPSSAPEAPARIAGFSR